MQTAIDLLTALLPLLYGLAAVNYLVYFVRRDPFAERTCSPFLLVAFTLHVGFFALRAAYFHRYPIASMPEMISAVALAVTGVYLYVERIQRSKVTGVFIVGLVLLVQLVGSTLLQHAGPPNPKLADNRLYGLHTMAAVLGHSAFAVGAVYAAMYVLLYRALKRKRFGLMFERLPSLDTLANMGFGATLLGWGLLTITILFGLVMSRELTSPAYRDPHTLAAIAVWLVYGGALLAYFLLGWRGARVISLTLVGFAFAVLAILGAAVWPSIHSFGA